MVDMDLVVILTGIFATLTGVPIARAIAKRVERRGLASDDVAEIRRRLDGIEQAVDSIAIEVERVAEAQRFTTKLLTSNTQAPNNVSPRAIPSPDSRLPEQRTPH